MNLVNIKLNRLRALFAVYFIALASVEISLGRGIWRGNWPEKIHSYKGVISSFGFLFLVILFAAGWWLFGNLLQKKQWARILLLIAGWLTVFDGVVSLLFISGSASFIPWLKQYAPGLVWERAIMLDRIKGILGLAFWGYAVYVLQFNPDVRQAFAPSQDSSGREE